MFEQVRRDLVTYICNGCAVAGSTDFGVIVFVLAMVVASILVGVLLLYVGVSNHTHGPFTLVEDRDVHEAIYRCVTCGAIVTKAEGYHSHLSIR
jgi:hypothetical protein